MPSPSTPPPTATKDQAKLDIRALVENYVKNKDGLQAQSETDTRVKFIDRMFQYLGWDVYGIKIPDEVQRELGIKTTETGKKKADYTFRINSITKLVVEAKAIGEDVDNDQYVSQVVNYAYNKVCSWAILTNFRYVRIFFVGNKKGGTSFERINLYQLDDYDSNFERLWTLSKESILANGLEQEAKKRGLTTNKIRLDEELFNDLKAWRELLSDDIRGRYGDKYTPNLIDHIVQRIIDRLIFIRKTEDDKLEEPKLNELIRRNNRSTYNEIKKVFVEYKQKYESKQIEESNDSFHEADRIDFTNQIIEEVVRGTYGPKNSSLQYDFANIDSDILGAIYEQYLAYILAQEKMKGKRKKKVKLEGGIAHRKEQGIYYTPTKIVEYVVNYTLGSLLSELKPEEIIRIKVLDPACGSGSFLVKAYDILNNYYLKHDKNYDQTKLDLSSGIPFSKKVEILKNNIFGVDLDAKAVEISQLNLLMKIAERAHRLPVLQNNIRCGNSLIDDESIEPDDYFKWEEKFPDIISGENGNFDVIIGNPPYIQLSMERTLRERLQDYLIQRFGSSMGRLNTFGFFIKLGFNLLKEGGRLGFIVPNTILTQEYYQELREMILSTCQIERIVNFKDLPFKDAVVENVIIVLKKNTKSEEKRLSNMVTIVGVDDSGLGFVEQRKIPQKTFAQAYKKAFTIYIDPISESLKSKIERGSKPLSEYFNINQAIALKYDRARYLSKVKRDDSYKKVLDGENIDRYYLHHDGTYLKYDINAIHSCKREDIFLSKEKLFFRRVGKRITATYDDQKFYALNTLVVMNKKPEVDYGIKYFLALFNSKLLNYYYHNFLKSTKTVFSEIQARQTKRLPIKIESDEDQLRSLVQNVEKILVLNKRLSQMGQIETDMRKQLESDIEDLDARIDEAVYRIYGLNEEERGIIASNVV